MPFRWRGDYDPFYEEENKSVVSSPKKTKTVSKKKKNTADEINAMAELQNHRILLQKYSEKLDERNRSITKIETDSLQKIKDAQEELRKYSVAVYNLEYRIMDYVKRFEKKELALFDEIANNANVMKEYAKTASEAGFDFEKEFSAALSKNGFYDVEVTQQSNDFGADILACKDGIKYVIQCKKYSSAVGVEAVQQAYASKVHYKAHVAVVATNSVFTIPAKILAEETGVLLWDGGKTNSMVNS